jgi:hypothetical protein
MVRLSAETTGIPTNALIFVASTGRSGPRRPVPSNWAAANLIVPDGTRRAALLVAKDQKVRDCRAHASRDFF